MTRKKRLKRAKLRLIRFFLILLLLGVMFMIFGFSAQDGVNSGKLSLKITKFLGDRLHLFDVGDTAVLNRWHHYVRKAGHFCEYGLLGVIASLFLLTYDISRFLQFFISAQLCFLYACTDEIHQLSVAGRGGQFKDVLIDTSGALTGCLFIFLLAALLFPRRKQKHS